MEIFKFKNEVKDKAKDRRQAPNDIISSAAFQVSQAVAAAFPCMSSIKKTVRRVQQKDNIGLVVPMHRKDFVCTDQTKTNKGKQFIMFDSLPSANRMLIFSTDRNLQFLYICLNFYADGTFKTVPSILEQYTIHAVKNGLTIPLIFGLLPNKKEETYAELLQQMRILAPNLSVDSILTYFETGMRKAIASEFPSCLNMGVSSIFANEFIGSFVNMVSNHITTMMPNLP
ncbi:uncharacterized protein [Palaemon carinicauda]|uniref:uncharacterized protein n=1 Tax=Palaemon carinicauda TaxID=392227 RepID=UPI0035B5D310